MNRCLILAAIPLILAGTSLSARAESPWESGSFKGYDDQQSATPSAPSVDADTGAVGLQGFSLSPSANDDVPATPAPQPAKAKPTRPSAAKQTQAAAPKTGLAAQLDAITKSVLGQANDSSFITMTQQSIDTSLKASQLAQKSASSDMQKFAAQLASIYGGIQSDIAAIAQSNNIQSSITLPPSRLLDKLSSLTGKDFDTKYMQLQQQQFSMLSSAFKKESQDGQNDAVKAFATKELPMINQQKDMIRQSYMAALKQNNTATASAATSASGTSQSSPTK